MKKKDLKTVMLLIDLFDDFRTWTKDKHNINKLIIKYLESGTYEYFTSTPRWHHGGFVGHYYIEEKNHCRNGTLKKYRGQKVMVYCVGHYGNYDKHYLIAVIE